MNLARRIAARDGALAAIALRSHADRETLLRLMSHLGVRPSRLKNSAGWIAERLDRVKPNGGDAQMNRLHELETLSLGIAGKIALWEALRIVPEMAEHPDIDLAALAERAHDQRARVEAERMACARAALAPGATVHPLRAERPA